MAPVGQTRMGTATRRGVIKGMAAVAGTLAPAMIGAPAIARTRPARIGVLLPTTGGIRHAAPPFHAVAAGGPRGQGAYLRRRRERGAGGRARRLGRRV